jgi:hypothetical protein
VQPGHHVEDRDPGPVRRTVRVPGEAHQPRDRLHHQVVAGVVGACAGAETADRRVHDLGVAGGDGVVVQREALEPAGPEVLDHDVGPGGEALGHVEVRGLLQVQRDRPLVPVDAQVVRRDVVAHGRHPRAGVVAGRALDLDHLGAEVGEQHRRVRARQDPGEVRDEQSAEGSHVPPSQ